MPLVNLGLTWVKHHTKAYSLPAQHSEGFRAEIERGVFEALQRDAEEQRAHRYSPPTHFYAHPPTGIPPLHNSEGFRAEIEREVFEAL